MRGSVTILMHKGNHHVTSEAVVNFYGSGVQKMRLGVLKQDENCVTSQMQTLRYFDWCFTKFSQGKQEVSIGHWALGIGHFSIHFQASSVRTEGTEEAWKRNKEC